MIWFVTTGAGMAVVGEFDVAAAAMVTELR
jgi:hypothetical protein